METLNQRLGRLKLGVDTLKTVVLNRSEQNSVKPERILLDEYRRLLSSNLTKKYLMTIFLSVKKVSSFFVSHHYVDYDLKKSVDAKLA